jgi:integrase
MKQMIDRAMFWRFIPQVENPIKLVKVKGSSTREKKPIISPIEHVNALIAALDEPYDLMVLVAATLGLRVSEVVALQWIDFDFEQKKVTIRRAYTHSTLGKPKSKASEAELPIEDSLLDQLLEFRSGDSEWVFPSPVTGHSYSADNHLRVQQCTEIRHPSEDQVVFGLIEGLD